MPKFITRHEYESPIEGKWAGYNERRWRYVKRVIERIGRLGGIERVLELGAGPGCRSIVIGADTMDNEKDFKPSILHDAGSVPWPIPDKHYDLFLALQVFEHLNGRQIEAFQEVRRVAHHAILTLPHMCRTTAHRIDEKTYLTWFGKWDEIELVYEGSCKKKMLYFNLSKP